MAEEYFEKFKSLANENDAEAFVYLRKAADLWHQDAVKSVVSLYRSGFWRMIKDDHATRKCERADPSVGSFAMFWKIDEKKLASLARMIIPESCYKKRPELLQKY